MPGSARVSGPRCDGSVLMTRRRQEAYYVHMKYQSL